MMPAGQSRGRTCEARAEARRLLLSLSAAKATGAGRAEADGGCGVLSSRSIVRTIYARALPCADGDGKRVRVSTVRMRWPILTLP
jgi:hypothetical protein